MGKGAGQKATKSKKKESIKERGRPGLSFIFILFFHHVFFYLSMKSNSVNWAVGCPSA
jgi:hypothetical protein